MISMRTFVVLACITIAACSAERRGEQVAPALDATDPEAALAIVRAREDAVRTLRATFRAEVHARDESGEPSARAVGGVLLVRKPEDFRLRLTLPLGLTVFDYLARGERVSVVRPLARGDDPADFRSFSREDLGQAFLRGGLAFPGTCAARRRSSPWLVFDCLVGGAKLLRQIRVDPDTGRIAQERSFRNGHVRLLLEYDDFRAADGADLPHRILLVYPDEGVHVDIEVDRYEVNPVLAERLFEPAEP